jgi:holo-[acyl-carrier protein] synthase
MSILGHGVDLVDCERIEQLLRKGDDFATGWFTDRELAQLGARADRANVIAGRVAVKEAVAKALGCGFAGDVSWHDVEVFASDAGAPRIELSGGALDVARSLGVTRVLVSVSNERTFAMASAIALGPKGAASATSQDN